MSKAPKTQTTVQNTTVPEYVQNAQQTLMDGALNLTSPWLQSPPSNPVAGFNDDQRRAFGAANLMVDDAFIQSPTRTSAHQPGTATSNFHSVQGTSTANPHLIQGTSTANPHFASASQLGARDIADFQNPYEQQVVDSTLRDMSRQFGEQMAGARAKMSAAGGYGGSRQAVLEGQMQRDFGDNVAQTVAGLRQSGFNTAANLGMGNAQMRQQTGLQNSQLGTQNAQFNAGQDNQLRSTNAQLGTQNAQFNAGQDNQIRLANAQMDNANGQFNAAQANAINQANANRVLQADQLNNQFTNDYAQRRAQALGILSGFGGMQQAQAQRETDVPYQMLDRLRSTVPGTYGGTSSSTAPNPNYVNPAQQLLGLGLTGASMFSDRNAKTDIEKLGKEDGVEMYAYRYKGDPKSYPKVVGPMAQDLERDNPGSTRKIGGKLVVNLGMGRAA